MVSESSPPFNYSWIRPCYRRLRRLRHITIKIHAAPCGLARFGLKQLADTPLKPGPLGGVSAMPGHPGHTRALS